MIVNDNSDTVTLAPPVQDHLLSGLSFTDENSFVQPFPASDGCIPKTVGSTQPDILATACEVLSEPPVDLDIHPDSENLFNAGGQVLYKVKVGNYH